MSSTKLLYFLIINLSSIYKWIESETINPNKCFRAAVYEHIPLGNISVDNPFDIIKSNLDVYEDITIKASELGTNILVFPEDAIICPVLPRSHVSTYTESIPEPQNGKIHNPCKQSSIYRDRPILQRLSCMAKNNNIYIVADMGDSVKCSNKTDSNCPDDGHYLFNTAVAFDSEGYLVAKYHKMQLYYEPYYNPAKYDITYFDTPFGRMGLHICFDILYKLPGTELVTKHNVTTMIFPTWWFDELPFVSAVEIQQAWAITNKVNFLASNVHVPQSGSLGSGIYSGERGAVIYTDTPDHNSRLLIADIPIDSGSKSAKCLENPFTTEIAFESRRKFDAQYNHENMNMEGFLLWKLSNQNDSYNACNNGFCCHFNYTVESNQTLKDESFWFIVSNRTGSALVQKHYPICEEICGVVKCDLGKDKVCRNFPTVTDPTIFKSIQLSATFSTRYSYPSVTANDLTLVPKSLWKYQNDGQIGSEVRLEVNGVEQPILSAGLYGRCYDRDPPYKQ